MQQSIENHLKLKDPERHKAKLLDLLEKEENYKLIPTYLYQYNSHDLYFFIL